MRDHLAFSLFIIACLVITGVIVREEVGGKKLAIR